MMIRSFATLLLEIQPETADLLFIVVWYCPAPTHPRKDFGSYTEDLDRKTNAKEEVQRTD